MAHALWMQLCKKKKKKKNICKWDIMSNVKAIIVLVLGKNFNYCIHIF